VRQWEVYALRYAVHERRASENFLRPPDPHDAPMPINYFVWVLRAGGDVIDTGFTLEGGARRGRTMIRPVEAALRRPCHDAQTCGMQVGVLLAQGQAIGTAVRSIG
jgi:hypothetical protein